MVNPIQSYIGVNLTPTAPSAELNTKGDVVPLNATSKLGEAALKAQVNEGLALMDTLASKLRGRAVGDVRTLSSLPDAKQKEIAVKANKLCAEILKNIQKEAQANPGMDVGKARENLAGAIEKHVKTVEEHYKNPKIDEAAKKLANENMKLIANENKPEIMSIKSESEDKIKARLVARSNPNFATTPQYTALSHADQLEVSKHARQPIMGAVVERQISNILESPLSSGHFGRIGGDIFRHIPNLTFETHRGGFLPETDSNHWKSNMLSIIDKGADAVGLNDQQKGNLLANLNSHLAQNPGDLGNGFQKFFEESIRHAPPGSKEEALGKVVVSMAQNSYVAAGFTVSAAVNESFQKTYQTTVFKQSGAEGDTHVKTSIKSDGSIETKSLKRLVPDEFKEYPDPSSRPVPQDAIPNCIIRFETTTISNVNNPSTWDSKVEVFVEVPNAASDKNNMKLIDKAIVTPLINAGIHTHMEGIYT